MRSNMTMKLTTLAAAMGLVVSSGAFAADESTQDFTYQVDAINEISVSDDPGALTIDSATAGSQPDDATDATTTWAVTTNGTDKIVTAQLTNAMQSGVTLSVALTAASVGSSSGTVALNSTTAETVHTGLTKVIDSAKAITYTLAATVAAGVVTEQAQTVTFTITDA